MQCVNSYATYRLIAYTLTGTGPGGGGSGIILRCVECLVFAEFPPEASAVVDLFSDLGYHGTYHRGELESSTRIVPRVVDEDVGWRGIWHMPVFSGVLGSGVCGEEASRRIAR